MIDVLLPFHGRVDHFREAVRSVLEQTSPDWRLVVVDDAYPEDVSGWLTELADPRISYHRNDANFGFARTFQVCLELATAEHVVLLGGDDRLLPSYIDVVGTAARRTGATMVHPGVTVIDDDGHRHQPLTDRVKSLLRRRSRHGRLLTGERVATTLMHGAWTYFPSICWRREALLEQGFDPSFGLALDVRAIVGLLMSGGSMLLLDDVLFEYRRHNASASMKAAHSADRFRQERAFHDHMAFELAAHGWPRAARAARIRAASRLHAATRLPAAVRSDPAVARDLLRHIVNAEKGPSMQPDDTRSVAYADRLRDTARWKRVLNVQAPYRWNVRRQGLGRTIDVGCGVGRNLIALDDGSVGVDHNETSVRIARESGLMALTVDEWQRSDLRVPESFDGLLVAHVIEHLEREDAVKILNDYVQYLRPGGKAMLICPQEKGYTTDATHVSFTTGSDLEVIAREIGLQPESWFSFPFPRAAGRRFAYNEFCVLAHKPLQ